MSNREEMLARIRKALGREASGSARPSPPPAFDLAGIMPPIRAEDLLTRFEAELQALAGKAHRAESQQALDQIVRSILTENHAKRVVLSRNPLLAELGLPQRLSEWGIAATTWPADPAQAAEGSFRQDCFAADLGITGADFALAETGSLVLTSLTEGSQLSSLAPVVHVAFYRRSQLRASLDEVLEFLPVSRDPSQSSPARSVVFVTGPSRTADIEQILIRGVHGPRDVHAILVEDSCLPAVHST